MDIRVTRHDGASGFEAVKCIRNGQVFIYDTDWKGVFRAESPVQSAVPKAFPRDRRVDARDIPADGLKRGADNTIRIEGLGDRFHIDYIQVLQ